MALATKRDIQHMERALEIAARGRGITHPNPMVGAVVVKGQKIISEAYHRKSGRDHAEIAALKRAGQDARGAELYVTLEPCCHRGRTGPCVDAIIAAGIKRVIFASTDPDTRVRGRGARRLRNAGLLVDNGVLDKKQRELNEAYFHFNRTGRPFVIIKSAQSLDGRVAIPSGESQWITGKIARTYAHRLRAEADAVVVGAGTVRQDDPTLTVRHLKGPNPYRIVISSSLRLPPASRLLTNRSDKKTIIVSTASAIKRFSKSNTGLGELIYWPLKKSQKGRISLQEFLARAAEFGLRTLLIEGGPTLATSFLREGLVDKCVVITAPIILGAGPSSFGNLGIEKISEAPVFAQTRCMPLGNDMLFEGFPKKGV